MSMDILLALVPLVPSAVAMLYLPSCSEEERIRHQYWVALSVAVSFGGYFLTNGLIKVVGEYNQRAGLSGKDMGKKGSKDEDRDVPEALGLVPGIVYLMCTIFSQLIFAHTPQEKVTYNSALFSVCFMIFLGFTDDVLDLKWRYKLILPTVASLPLLSSYSGQTAMFVPHGALRSMLWDTAANKLTMFAYGGIIELGWLFLVYMGLLAVFCTNSINIMAGINGLEAGQSYIIASAVLFFKIYEMAFRGSGTCVARGSEAEFASQHQVFTILMVLPFIGTTLALLKYNWFPAKVFVGDTYCYFAGMTFAVIGIHGHFSKTLLMLFIPQIYNFVISVPQVFGFVPCPRHRLPQYRLIKLHKDAEECPNFTIICTILRVFGPMKEKQLTVFLLGLQILTSIIAFYVRYILFEIPIRD
eukprot:GSChrysophyteH2.ASY1.ANO1.1363.1 assembled CDS